MRAFLLLEDSSHSPPVMSMTQIDRVRWLDHSAIPPYQECGNHSLVLNTGTVPLDLLKRQANAWVRMKGGSF
jgi:hypothetical protein